MIRLAEGRGIEGAVLGGIWETVLVSLRERTFLDILHGWKQAVILVIDRETKKPVKLSARVNQGHEMLEVVTACDIHVHVSCASGFSTSHYVIL